MYSIEDDLDFKINMIFEMFCKVLLVIVDGEDKI